MKLKNWLEKWNLSSLKINVEFLELELMFSDTDKHAAWEMYVELLTRVTTQELDEGSGDEETALSSIHSLFDTTREILKKHGASCIEYTKIAVIVLNQVIRPFTSKWHKLAKEKAFENAENCKQFRAELKDVQEKITSYTRLLSDIAGVEDLTNLES